MHGLLPLGQTHGTGIMPGLLIVIPVGHGVGILDGDLTLVGAALIGDITLIGGMTHIGGQDLGIRLMDGVDLIIIIRDPDGGADLRIVNQM